MSTWSKEKEDVCILKHVGNIQQCARNHGETIGPKTARSIAFGMMLVEKHQKTTEQVLYDYIQARRVPPGIMLSGEEAAKLVEEGVVVGIQPANPEYEELRNAPDDVAAKKYANLLREFKTRTEGEALGRSKDRLPVLEFYYTNHHGTLLRRVVPRNLGYGITEGHPEPTWFLQAWDIDRQAERTFVLTDMRFSDEIP